MKFTSLFCTTVFWFSKISSLILRSLLSIATLFILAKYLFTTNINPIRTIHNIKIIGKMIFF